MVKAHPRFLKPISCDIWKKPFLPRQSLEQPKAAIQLPLRNVLVISLNNVMCMDQQLILIH